MWRRLVRAIRAFTGGEVYTCFHCRRTFFGEAAAEHFGGRLSSGRNRPVCCRHEDPLEEWIYHRFYHPPKEEPMHTLATVTADISPHFQGMMINSLAAVCHKANQTWWHDPATGEKKKRNVGELLMLCVSELAEAMEGDRKNLQDDKLPHRKMFEVELADCLIRIFDLGAGLGLDLGGAFIEKMEYNRNRADHKPEHRLAEGGKKY